MWCIPEITPEFEKRMMDVLSVYEKDYDPDYPVICFDEKPHQLRSIPRGEMLAKPGRPRRVDYEYKREGTVNHFVAVEPKAGRRYIRTYKKRTGKEFSQFMRFIVKRTYKNAKKVLIVLDNLSTHFQSSILKHLGDEAKDILDRIEFHYTPNHASWLNMAEIEIGILTQRVLRKHISDSDELKEEIRAYQGVRNISEAKIDWGFTREQAKKVFDLHVN